MIQKTQHDQKDGIPATLEAFECLINCEQPYRYELTQYDLRTRSGIITDMTGSSWAHAQLITRALVQFELQLQSGPCSVITGQHVSIPEHPTCIPDVVITCDVGDRNQSGLCKIRSPLLVIEVLSPSTERYDRTEKFQRYQHCPSLEVYILVSQQKRSIEVYRRNCDWKQEVYESGVIRLDVLDLELDIEQLYQGVLP
uniref:Putative restriction endonuclease domain-containing protein n=1 Tax=Thermosporothrix sp. COM3 TaxID=2490863 RepID=A0A455SFV8_9CHLR|nr:hypothetical protein KTC_21040 [Thermosporothrix sp. COM3]